MKQLNKSEIAEETNIQEIFTFATTVLYMQIPYVNICTCVYIYLGAYLLNIWLASIIYKEFVWHWACTKGLDICTTHIRITLPL